MIKLDLVPSCIKPVLHASQYDDGRQWVCQVLNDGAPFVFQNGDTVDYTIRKGDGLLVTGAVAVTPGTSTLTLVSTEQMCAVYGSNLGELTITSNGSKVGSVNFILEVERAPDEGGVQSQSEINNLARQVHDIVAEELADNGAEETGYDNTESGLDATNVQDALDELAQKPSVDAYTKQESDEKYATKTELSAKADVSAIPTKTSQLQNDSGFTQIDDSEESASKTYSSEKIEGKLLGKANNSTVEELSNEVGTMRDDMYNTSPNLFNFDNIASNKVPSWVGSKYDEFVDFNGWKTSNYIPVEAGEQYALIYNAEVTQGKVFYVCAYKNGVAVYRGEQSNPYIVPNDVDHIRFFSNSLELFADRTTTSFKKYNENMNLAWCPYGEEETYLKVGSFSQYGVYVDGNDYYHFVYFADRAIIRKFRQDGPNNIFQFSALYEGNVNEYGVFIGKTISTNGTDTVGPISIMRQGIDNSGEWSGGWHTKTVNGVAYPTAEQNSLDVRVNGESIVGKNGIHYGKCVAVVKNNLYFPQTIIGDDLSQATKAIEETVYYYLDDKMTTRVLHKYMTDVRVILYYGMQAIRIGFDSALLPNNELAIIFADMTGEVALDNPESLICVKNDFWNYDLTLQKCGLGLFTHNDGTGVHKYADLPSDIRKIYWTLIEGDYSKTYITAGTNLFWEGIYDIYPS